VVRDPRGDISYEAKEEFRSLDDDNVLTCEANIAWRKSLDDPSRHGESIEYFCEKSLAIAH